MSDTGAISGPAVFRAASAPETIATFAVLVLAWGAGFADVLPKEVWVVDFPALAVAMLFDTFAFNELGVREYSVFYPALAVSLYLEAMVVGALVRWGRRQNVGFLRRDSAE